MEVKLSETFNSIQGEGPLQGRPAFFIRLAGCNLKCSFCDTPYAQEGVKTDNIISIPEIRDQMLELARLHGNDYPFVITGGEPLLQQDDIKLLLGTYFARSAKRANVWFETNGTIVPDKELVVKYYPKFVVSPKVGHTNNEALKALSLLGAHFKFVIDDKAGWNFKIAMQFAREFDVPKERIWMQPMAADKKALSKAGEKLWGMCVGCGVGYSPRLHIALFGTKRGI